ncbi:MAG: hypothetical protein RLZZ282_57 [Verrucomicrobiota bacterium]|jgi:hypothetical protein
MMDVIITMNTTHPFTNVTTTLARYAGMLAMAAPWIAMLESITPCGAQENAAAAFESGVLLPASDLLPADLLQGSSYRVRDEVVTDGYMAHFQIDSDFGGFDAIGVPQANRRIVEAQAIRKLVETSKSDLFAEGMTQAELALRDKKSLAAMGVADAQIKRFQIQPALSTTRRHRIVLAMEAMPKANGRGEMIRLANACTTPEEEDFLIGALAILAERQTTGAADYIALKVIGRLPGATNATGELHVPAPVDHVTWTEGVADFARRDDLGAAPKVLLHTGTLSPAVSVGLTAAGWKIVAVAYPAH